MLDKKKIMKLAETAIRSAGALLNDRALAENVSLKDRDDFVTKTDILVQERLRAELKNILPEADFAGEELRYSKISESGICWVLDPVDGTSNLIHDFKYSAISLALLIDGTAELGIVYNPFSDELFSAVRGEGSRLNDKPIKVSEEIQLKRCNISVGAAPGDRGASEKVFDIMRRVYDSCHDVRRMGAAALELCYVACGRQDGYYEFKLKPWDYLAGQLIVTEAGGVALTPSGEALSKTCAGDILAANPDIWQKLSEIILRNHVDLISASLK